MNQTAPTGDRGQRYEIHMITKTGEDTRVGWQDVPTGHLVLAALGLPECDRVKVIDRDHPDAEPIIHHRPGRRPRQRQVNRELVGDAVLRERRAKKWRNRHGAKKNRRKRK